MVAVYLQGQSFVAKQKVLLFTVNITRNRMQNPIIKNIWGVAFFPSARVQSIAQRQAYLLFNPVEKNIEFPKEFLRNFKRKFAE
jgi:hypothetical protein